MKTVLVVSPHFPPVNAPDHQRVRMSLPYLEEFGWKPTVLAVRPECVEGAVTDPFLQETLPEHIEVIRVGAVPFYLTRFWGLGSLALRALMTLYVTGNRLLRSRKFDLIFFSSTQFPVMILGPMWKRKFSVPYVVDFQDPWWSDYYERNTNKQPPGGRLKYGLSQRVARRLEPPTVRNAAHVVCVSNAYVETFKCRYPDAPQHNFTVLPFGASESDFSSLKTLGVSQSVFDPLDGKEHWVYAGRGGQDMVFAVRAFFTALKRQVDEHPEQADRLRVHFIGTDYAPKERARKTIEPVARELGLDKIVTEQTERLPYFVTLRCLSDAQALFIPGSDDAGYTASKLYPYILAKKPLLAVFHRDSSVVEVMRKTRAGKVITFGGGRSVGEVADEIYQKWFAYGTSRTPETDWTAFAPYTARSMTQRLCEIFDRAAGRESKR
jgi:hypothetical protein